METIQILLVDDHLLVRQGIRTFLEDEEDLVIIGEAATGEEAVQCCSILALDVVLIDLAMPGMGGIEAIRQIKQQSPHSQIVVLTSFQDDAFFTLTRSDHPSRIRDTHHPHARTGREQKT